MTDELTLGASLSLSLLLGAGFGALYFRLLWRAAQGLTGMRGPPCNRQQIGAGRLVLGFAMRMTLTLVALALALAAGAEAAHLLAGVLGFGLVRHITAGRKRRRG
ncbi:hypothetical protein [Pseudophaeobacter flagellatus]|uniref:hypothetical protein n=1 Tax=Pseudophaeobacter flagellatus TaxID=2899119 RepID=UPI001E456191|nr:hypothetical protein [Pseudophaeobacter flagellatus]MCD9148778.1 hypothetical protein [Pseudophaeobacter flagellatus]